MGPLPKKERRERRNGMNKLSKLEMNEKINRTIEWKRLWQEMNEQRERTNSEHWEGIIDKREWVTQQRSRRIL